MAKKLIEVALPLKEISDASAQEKRTTARLPHPAKLHLWWARRPLVATRAIMFAQLVDDPSSHPERFPTTELQQAERERLFSILRGLVDINGPGENCLKSAQDEIQQCVGSVTVIDPFAGGGAIPIEAQRLGLDVVASDLNPVAVLLERLVLDQVRVALGRDAVHPLGERTVPVGGKGLAGLADDIEWYGRRLRDLAAETLAPLYPEVVDGDGVSRPVIAWIWARTVPCPNPACRIDAPLVRSFVISKKKGRERWVDPVTAGPGQPVEFRVREGTTPRIKSTVGRTGATCCACETSIPLTYVRERGRAGEMRQRLMAVAALGQGRREYFDQDDIQVTEAVFNVVDPFETDLAENPRDVKVRNYGMTTHASLFTPRQLTALTTLAGLVGAVRSEVLRDSGDDADYADLVATVLGVSISKLADVSNSLTRWLVKDEVPINLFARQAIPMVWDFAEGNPLGESSGSFMTIVEGTARVLNGVLVGYDRLGRVAVSQANAATRDYPVGCVVSTDPPYFDNIGYADLADFFYVWLRLGLRDIHPDLFRTLLTPKAEELVATPYRFDGDQQAANDHFEGGFRDVFARIKGRHDPDIPLTLYYAYKQEDDEATDDDGSSGAGATGWETLLQGLVDTGFQVTATWPIRTEMATRMIGRGTAALASSVVLVCRPRDPGAGVTDLRGFTRRLKTELAEKVADLQSGGVQPVDMAQAAIGPGMAVFTSYSRVIDRDNQPMSVGTALQIINRELDALQAEQESEFDADTRWAITWYEQYGLDEGDFGEAQVLATARSVAMNALQRSGIITQRAGRVRLLDRSEYPDDWDPRTDTRLTVWEVCQHLIRRLRTEGADSAAALVRDAGGKAEAARDLAYRLYEIANRKGWSEEAQAYNELAAEWHDLAAKAARGPGPSDDTLF